MVDDSRNRCLTLISLRQAFFVIGLCPLTVDQFGCAKKPLTVKLPPTPVTVAVPLEREVSDAVYFTGRTDGSEFVDVRARVSGYLTKIHFKPGTLVKEGDPLFEIDDRPYVIALEQAEGDLERVNARLKRSQSELERAEKLLEKKIMAREDYDRTVGDYGEAAASVRSAVAAVDRAKLDLLWTKINSPLTGLVSRELITVGNLVTSDQTKLTTILRQDPMYVYFDIDERTVLRILQLIREGKFKSARENDVPIQMALGNDNDFPHEGFVNFVDNRVDPTTGTMRIRGTFANPMQVNGSIKFAAGMFARVRIELTAKRPALLITERAILSDQDRKFVYVVNDKNDVERREVRLGVVENGLRAIDAGLEKTDRVIVNGVQRVRPGITVEPKIVVQPEPPKKNQPSTATVSVIKSVEP